MSRERSELDFLEPVPFKTYKDKIFGVLSPSYLKGFIFVEATAIHHVEKLIGRVGVSATPMKNCRKVLDGESPSDGHTTISRAKGGNIGNRGRKHS